MFTPSLAYFVDSRQILISRLRFTGLTSACLYFCQKISPLSDYKSVLPQDVSIPEFHGLLLGSVNPRPIAFVATSNDEGEVNLAPFSFFNVFGANPPVLIFSPARRGRDNTTKHTYENLKKGGECTVNIVSHDIVHQMVLASTEYPDGVNEFAKAGFTEEKSDLVSVPRVAESPSQMECRVKEIINYGELAGGGNLIIVEVLKIHVKNDILDENGKIDPFKIDTVGRCGGLWYTRPSDSLFSIENPKGKSNIGFDGLPSHILESDLLTGNDLAQLAKLAQLPSQEEVQTYLDERPEIQEILSQNDSKNVLHHLAEKMISFGDVEDALLTLMVFGL